MSSKRKNSCVWSFYTAEETTPYAVCTACQARIKRGKEGERASWSSKPLWNHLQKKHPDQHAEASGNRRKDEESVKKRRTEQAQVAKIYVNGTPKLQEFLAAKTKYTPDNPEQQQLTKLLSTWIADGVLPYGIIDNRRYAVVS